MQESFFSIFSWGCSWEIYSAVTFTIPIIYPIIVALGFDPIWFGVIIVLIIEMGLVTPPVGMNVFILGGMTGIPLDTIFRGIVPFFIAMVICVILLIIFPENRAVPTKDDVANEAQHYCYYLVSVYKLPSSIRIVIPAKAGIQGSR